jgi:hypothetical protein
MQEEEKKNRNHIQEGEEGEEEKQKRKKKEKTKNKKYSIFMGEKKGGGELNHRINKQIKKQITTIKSVK